MNRKKYWTEKVRNIGNSINESGKMVLLGSPGRSRRYKTSPPELNINWKKVRVIAFVMLLSVLF